MDTRRRGAGQAGAASRPPTRGRRCSPTAQDSPAPGTLRVCDADDVDVLVTTDGRRPGDPRRSARDARRGGGARVKLTILGGGGFRVPLVYGALLRDRPRAGRVTEVVLHDIDAARLARHRQVLRPARRGRAPTRRAVTRDHRPRRGPARAPTSSSPRSGSAASPGARATSGSRSTSACSARRRPARAAWPTRCAPCRSPSTSPSASRAVAPDAWVINFTNPAGIVTEAMQQVLGDRVIGICDSPIALARRAARRARARPGTRTDDRLRGAQPPRLAAGPACRRRATCCPSCSPTRRRCSTHRGGPALRRRLAPRPGRHPQRVPLLLLLHPRGGRRDPGGAADPRGVPAATSRTPSTTPSPRDPARRARRRGAGCAQERDATYMARGRAPRTRSATTPTSPAAATRAWRWRSWRPSAAASTATMILNVRNGGSRARAAARRRRRGARASSTATVRARAPLAPARGPPARAGAAGQGGRAARHRGRATTGSDAGWPSRRSPCTRSSTR